MQQAGNILLGVAASILAWLLIERGLKPKIAIRTKILKLEVDGKPTYRFMIRNGRRFRACVSISVTARFGVKALTADDQTWTMGNLNVDDATIPFLSPANNYRALRQPGRKFYPQQPVLLLETLPERFRNRVKQSSAFLLEDLFALGEQTTLALYIEGEDSFSGSKGYWVHEFEPTDIEPIDAIDRSGPNKTDDDKTGFGRIRARDVARYQPLRSQTPRIEVTNQVSPIEQEPSA